MQPGGKQPAPGALAVVQAFINTRIDDWDVDEIATLEGLGSWLRAQGLLDDDEAVDVGDVARAADLREGLRQLCLSNGGHETDAGLLNAFDRAAERVTMRLRITEDATPRLAATGSGVDRALGEILARVALAEAECTWIRLKACPTPTCRWAFYDHTRNRSARWCAMSICGQRTKAQAYRRRHAPG